MPTFEGSSGYDDRTDAAEHLVHLTRSVGRRSACANLYAIISDGRLHPGPLAFGAARDLDERYPPQRSVSLSELPIDMLGRLARKRSPYGLAFRRSHVIAAGGARVWYLDKETVLGRRIFESVRERTRRDDPSDILWALTPFVDFPGEYPTGSFRYAWEREWRVPAGLSFGIRDVAFLLMPETDHKKAARTRHIRELKCPLIDPTWSSERIVASLPAPQLDLTAPLVEASHVEPTRAHSEDITAHPEVLAKVPTWCSVCGPGSQLVLVDGWWRCNQCTRPARPEDAHAVVLAPGPEISSSAVPRRTPKKHVTSATNAEFRSLPELLAPESKPRSPADKTAGKQRKERRRRTQNAETKRGAPRPTDAPADIDWDGPNILRWKRGE